MTTAVLLSIPASMPRIIMGRDFGDAIRQEVIDRWALCVDKVITFNCTSEVHALETQISGAELVEVAGPLRVKISSMAKLALERGYDTIVISNADCIPIDVKLMLELIQSTGSNCAKFLRRANIDTATHTSTREVFRGIDAFVLSKEAMSKIPNDATWAIGQPAWDIWLPILLLTHGVTLNGFGVNIFAHINHEQRWNESESLANARKLLSELPIKSFGFGFPPLENLPPYNPNWPDKTVKNAFEVIYEQLFRLENSGPTRDDQFNSLWLQILKMHFGPNDKVFSSYVAASGHPIRRWLIKNGLIKLIQR